MESNYVDLLIKRRWLFALLTLVFTLLIGAGVKDIYQDQDYKSFFDTDDPERVSYENQQETYTKTDSLLILIDKPSGDIFTKDTLKAIESVTEQAWRIPFAIRVDSITNFQHSYAEGDDLIVEYLVEDSDALDAEELARIKAIALNERQLVGRLLSKDTATTLMLVSLDMPAIDTEADLETQQTQRKARATSFGEVYAASQALKAQLVEAQPELVVHMMGVPMVNHSFNRSAQNDVRTLIPMMYGLVLLLLLVFFRSVMSMLVSLVVIIFGTVAGLGFMGWTGVPITMITVIAPVIILTISVCDSVHLIAVYLARLAEGEDRIQAMRSSLSVNFGAVILTSITTTIGFLTLNFADSPNFRNLGNIAAAGVMWAMVVSLCLLPALQIALVRKPTKSFTKLPLNPLANFIIGNSRKVFVGCMAVAVLLISMLPLNTIDDEPTKYFNPGNSFRDAADYAGGTLPAIKNMDFSVDCGKPNCIHDPQYLKDLEGFVKWLENEEEVEYVVSYIDIIKKLNQNMHGDDAQWYRLPEQTDLSAQYHLLYEFSLPEGLDMNNQVSLDKSSTRVHAWITKMSTPSFLDMKARAENWLKTETGMETRGASVNVMFANLAERTINSMISGALFAILGVTITIFLALRSFKYGLLSILPNAFPAVMAMGLWGLIKGEVNMSVAVVFSITLGLVVDNTVHYISKFRQGMEKFNNTDDAIRYAFEVVGPALVITAAVLSMGFGLLATSDFNVNGYMGMITAITIVIALVFDFLMLPAMLKMMDRKKA